MSSKAMAALVESLTKLPGVGTKTAARLAYHIAAMKADDVENLAAAIRSVKLDTRACEICFNTIDADKNICDICASTKRDGKIICVVKDAKDLDAIERAGTFDGKYHVTGGLISPLAGVSQEDIHLRELIKRVGDEKIEEVIIAFEPTVEGDATALFISRLLNPAGVKVTKLARGLAVGADFAGTDSLTIAKAIENRVPV
ncbi:MAG: recombination protein RecR [Selenomonadaceae bacterium]|nr:recombination protein RecR [Selenomonadaceae bacterium]MBQ4402923.1 recombination protein RecR [Selenomonadaceae bacterium]MBQ6131687.1 recombination protein RecR [Selenomonadaceae bacterium]